MTARFTAAQGFHPKRASEWPNSVKSPLITLPSSHFDRITSGYGEHFSSHSQSLDMQPTTHNLKHHGGLGEQRCVRNRVNPLVCCAVPPETRLSCEIESH